MKISLLIPLGSNNMQLYTIWLLNANHLTDYFKNLLPNGSKVVNKALGLVKLVPSLQTLVY
ncbi:MAG: hypothetical protein JWR09_899 [Mucilaginibacter sp.]|nr:hypothetical protein [Mucilaginibacter sp.]